MHVDGGLQRLSFLYFHTFSKILPFGDTLLSKKGDYRSLFRMQTMEIYCDCHL